MQQGRDAPSRRASTAARTRSSNAENAGTADGRGLLGWYYPDEWDAFLQSTVTRKDLEKSILAPQAGRISFLTLTNHFYSLATPLPQGKGMYPTLMSIPDVIGFDLYPLQVWCRPAFGDVMDAQRELRSTSGGKPTFQWIEVAPMEHQCNDHEAARPDPGRRFARRPGSQWPAAQARSATSRTTGRGDRQRDRAHEPRDQVAGSRVARSVQVRLGRRQSASARTLNGAIYVIASTPRTAVRPSRRCDPAVGDGLGGGSRALTQASDYFGPSRHAST